MGDYEFIQENSSWTKFWVLVTSLIILALILIVGVFFSTFFYKILQAIPYVNGSIGFIILNIKSLTLFGILLAHLFGGLFFVPSPDEIIFYYSLIKGNNYFLTLLFSIVGYMLAQLLNYYLGKKISPLIMHIVSKKKVYETRRYVNKYGAWGIFLFNFIPLPAPLLTFALGIARYNFTRLFVLTLAGQIAKYTLLMLSYLLFV